MKAVVLVGGFGTRLRPLTLTVPKNLVPVAGLPLIERVVGWLGSHGVDEVVLAMGYKPDAFYKAFPDGTAASIPLRYVVEPEPLDTGGAIGFAAREAGIKSTFIVANGDVLTDIDITTQLAFHRRSGAEGTIALTPVEDPSRFGVVPTDHQGRVQAFIEKPDRDKAPTDLINAGTYILEPSVLDRIPCGQRVSVERKVFPEMASEGRLFALPHLCYWLDVGVPVSYLQGTRDLIDGTRTGQPVLGANYTEGVWHLEALPVEGKIEGPALIGRNVRIAAGANVAGSTVGDHVKIEEGALVRDAIVLDGARIGAGARIERSIISPGAVIGTGAVIEELSVVGQDAKVPNGEQLSGARYPEAQT